MKMTHVRLERSRALQTALLLALAATPTTAAVLKVDATGGPGVFTSIQDAVDAAASGDTIVVTSQTSIVQPTFVVDGKGLQIVADTASPLLIDYEFAPAITVRNLPAGEPVVLRNLWALPNPIGLGDPRGEGLLVEHCQADVWVEDCDLRGATGYDDLVSPHKDGFAAARVADCDKVTFVRCTLRGGAGFTSNGLFTAPVTTGPGAAALDASASHVHVYDGTLAGGAGGSASSFLVSSPVAGSDGGAGARLDGGFLFVSGSSLTGGAGGHGDDGSPTCGAGGDGGDGLLLVGTAPHAVRLDTTATGGAAGLAGGAGCASDGAPGQDVVVAPGGTSQVLPGTARHFSQGAVTRESQTMALDIGGNPGDLVLLAVGFAPDAVYLPYRKGVLLPAFSTIILISLPALPASGSLHADVVLPELGPGIDGGWLFDQAALHDASDGWVLTPPSASLLLDASL